MKCNPNVLKIWTDWWIYSSVKLLSISHISPDISNTFWNLHQQNKKNSFSANSFLPFLSYRFPKHLNSTLYIDGHQWNYHILYSEESVFDASYLGFLLWVLNQNAAVQEKWRGSKVERITASKNSVKQKIFAEWVTLMNIQWLSRHVRERESKSGVCNCKTNETSHQADLNRNKKI